MWYCGFVGFLYIKLRESNSQLSQLLNKYWLTWTPWVRWTQSKHTPSVRTSSLPLLFSIWMTKVKPIPLPQLHTCRSCPFAPWLQQCSAPVSQALEHLRIHRTDHPRIPKQPSCALYLLFLITFVVWNNKAVYKELQHIKDNSAGLWLSCAFQGVVSSAFAWWQEEGEEIKQPMELVSVRRHWNLLAQCNLHTSSKAESLAQRWPFVSYLPWFTHLISPRTGFP